MFFYGRQLLDDTDSRVAYYSSAFLLKARYIKTYFLSCISVSLQPTPLQLVLFTNCIVNAENDDG